MTQFLLHINTFARIQFRRHLKSPALWFVALATPVAARFMVPGPGSDYAVLTINNARPLQTAGVIGMELGIIAALLLSPFAYIFLRAGPTRIVPWQVEDITPSRHTAHMLGNWIADTLILWLILLCLAVAGVIISFFRLPLDAVAPHETLLGTLLIAAPALAFIAALRTYFSARPLLRGASGDVMFFLVWLGGIIMASAYFIGDTSPRAISDLFGFAASMSPAVAEPIQFYTIGSSPNMQGTIEVDAMAGVLDPDFLLSRLFWLAVAGGLAALGGVLFKPRSQRQKPKRLANAKFITSLSVGFDKVFSWITPKSSRFFAPLWENLNQILTPKSYILILLIVAGAGWVLPFKTFVGPAIWLALLFPLTTHSGRWQSRNLTGFAATLPSSPSSQFIWRLLAGVFLALLVCLPAIIKSFAREDITVFPDIAFMVLGLPFIIMVLGTLTRSAFFARLLLLMAWYMYLNM